MVCSKCYQKSGCDPEEEGNRIAKDFRSILTLSRVCLPHYTVNPSSCSDIQYHGNLHILLQAEVLMHSFVICLWKSLIFFPEKNEWLVLPWSLKAQGSYPVSLCALLLPQHGSRCGLICTPAPPWRCQGSWILESMAWQFYESGWTEGNYWTCMLSKQPLKRSEVHLRLPRVPLAVSCKGLRISPLFARTFVQGLYRERFPSSTNWNQSGSMHSRCAASFCFSRGMLLTSYFIFQHVGQHTITSSYSENMYQM